MGEKSPPSEGKRSTTGSKETFKAIGYGWNKVKNTIAARCSEFRESSEWLGIVWTDYAMRQWFTDKDEHIYFTE